MKLHLGCGQRYLEGYLNIDLPPSQNSVIKTVADLHANILDLRHEPESIDEIRSHHVFEHFSRPVACALLACWFSWLRIGGGLRIEVPDFLRTARVVLGRFSSFRSKAIAERHIFGSHEAEWAAHREGYSEHLLHHMVTSFGFEVQKVRNNSWRGTYNLELFARKGSRLLTREGIEGIAAAYLENFLVDNSVSECQIHGVWMKAYRAQVARGWATGA